MKTILVCNQKGGVGKSLVADEIAFSFERSGIPVSCRRVRGRVRPQGQGREGDARPGGHGARGCGVPEGITAGQSRVPYGQIETQGV